MKIYLAQNVLDAALDRIRWLFDEFPNVIVGFSGGKDSTVVFNLALMVAKEKNRLPLKVFFIDQEAEWGTVIEYIRTVMNCPEVEPLWLQCPIKIFNATSAIEPWLYCWEEGKIWMREKEPNSIKINRYGTDRFHDLFNRFVKVEYPNTKTCILGGVRTEESPQRLVGLTSGATYKWVTWGKTIKGQTHCIFYPLYDWSYTDIWKAIHDNRWAYCRIYDYMYQHGVPLQNMRVSNVHHETAVYALFHLQEIESDTWNRITERISGVNTAGQLNNDFWGEKELPFMFESWEEYRDYLLDNLITSNEVRTKFRRKFEGMDKIYSKMVNMDILHKTQIQTILLNDYHFTKLGGFESSKASVAYRKWLRGLPLDVVKGKVHNEFIPKPA